MNVLDVELSNVLAVFGVENVFVKKDFVLNVKRKLILMLVKCGICGESFDVVLSGTQFYWWVKKGVLPKLWICDLHVWWRS